MDLSTSELDVPPASGTRLNQPRHFLPTNESVDICIRFRGTFQSAETKVEPKSNANPAAFGLSFFKTQREIQEIPRDRAYEIRC